MTQIRRTRTLSSRARRHRPLPRTTSEAARELPAPVRIPTVAALPGTVQATNGFRYLPPATYQALPGPSAPLDPFDSLMLLFSAGFIEPISRSVDLLFDEPQHSDLPPSAWYRA